MEEEMKPEGVQPEEEEEVSEEEEKSLPFPMATVVREMKKSIDKDKMVRKEVKIGMNNFLGDVTQQVSESLNKYPYSMIDYRMFQESIAPFKKVKELRLEKERLVAHLDAIIKDCESIKRDVEEKFGEQEKV